MIIERHSDIRQRLILRLLSFYIILRQIVLDSGKIDPRIRRWLHSIKLFLLASAPPLCVLLLPPSTGSLWALDPSQPASTYIRTHFTDNDGLPGNVVNEIVQSRDGFLWLLVGGGLVRFDGRHFNGFQRPAYVRSLALAPDGDLWLGTNKDLERVPATALNQFDHLPAISHDPIAGNNSVVKCLRFGRRGVLWVGTTAGLYRFQAGAFSLVLPQVVIDRIEETASGHLLVITSEGFVELDEGRVVPHPELAAQLDAGTRDILHVVEDSHGVTWFCTKKGVARRIGGAIEKLAPYGAQGPAAFRAYEDPSGNVWIAKADGLFRATSAGLELVAADLDVRYIYGDREGDLWVGANGGGLYRFKDSAARVFTTADGLPNKVAMTVLAARDQTIWAGFNCGGLSRFDGQRFQTYNEKNGLRNSCVWSLAEDAKGDLWIGTFGGGVFHFHNGEFTQYSKAQGLASDIVSCVITARDGSVWVATPAGVARIRDGQIRNYTTADGLSYGIRTVYQDRAGDIWVGTLHGIDRFAGDRFVNVSSFPRTFVIPVGEDHAGNFYFTYPGGFAPGGILRIENNRPVLLAEEGKPSGLAETDRGELWFGGISILRIPAGGLDHPHQGDDPLNYEVFGRADGLTSPIASEGRPNMALAGDGRLWIATAEGLLRLDLLRLPKSDLRPAIYLKQITVDRNLQLPSSQLILPAGTHHIELNFDAIEISSPEKIRLQYRLDQVDSEWLDSDPPGHATYSTLTPGTHAFHVRACNRSGIWDRVGTVYYITQQPYFYQTRWFRAATIAFGLLVIAGLYQLRMRQLARTLTARFDERLAERTRIARELHDTLLQTFSASLLRFQSVSKMLPARPDEAKLRVDTAIEQASSAIAEGRDAVHQLRAGASTDVDLVQSISNFVGELAGSSGENLPGFRLQVEGTPRDLDPLLRDEAYRIAAEALRNAVRYAGARQIEVEIRYDEQQLRLRIRDDGKGIAPGVLEQGYASGHWGLRGMRERAKLLGGNLEVWSQAGSGTEIELAVPAARAYARPASRWSILLNKWWN